MNNSSSIRLFFRVLFVFFWILAFSLFMYLLSYWGQYKQKGSLNLLTWAQVIDADFLHDFEKETGIKVNLSYFEHNEEVYAKLKATPDHGYDLVMPSDFMVETMIKEGMLQQIDTQKLDFWHNVHEALKGHYFDPDNLYTVPYYWGFFGLAIDTSVVDIENIDVSWSLIFEKDSPADSFSVTNDSRELFFIAADYLFGHAQNLTEKEIIQIKELLILQKKNVTLYTDMRPDYAIASRTCPMGTIFVQDLLKVMSEFDFIDFIIPKEGMFTSIDSFVVPKESQKQELIYAFLNYLYNSEVLQKYIDRYEFFPAVDTVHLDHRATNRFIPTKKFFSKAKFFKNIIPEKILYDVWLSLKAY